MTLSPITREYRCIKCGHHDNQTQPAFTVFSERKVCPACNRYTLALYFEDKKAKKSYRKKQLKQAGAHLKCASHSLRDCATLRLPLIGKPYIVIDNKDKFEAVVDNLKCAGEILKELP